MQCGDPEEELVGVKLGVEYHEESRKGREQDLLREVRLKLEEKNLSFVNLSFVSLSFVNVRILARISYDLSRQGNKVR